MRCKCCDADNAYWWRGDSYCGPCREAIMVTIKEDRVKDFYYGGPSVVVKKSDEVGGWR